MAATFLLPSCSNIMTLSSPCASILPVLSINPPQIVNLIPQLPMSYTALSSFQGYTTFPPAPPNLILPPVAPSLPNLILPTLLGPLNLIISLLGPLLQILRSLASNQCCSPVNSLLSNLPQLVGALRTISANRKCSTISSLCPSNVPNIPNLSAQPLSVPNGGVQNPVIPNDETQGPINGNSESPNIDSESQNDNILSEGSQVSSITNEINQIPSIAAVEVQAPLESSSNEQNEIPEEQITNSSEVLDGQILNPILSNISGVFNITNVPSNLNVSSVNTSASELQTIVPSISDIQSNVPIEEDIVGQNANETNFTPVIQGLTSQIINNNPADTFDNSSISAIDTITTTLSNLGTSSSIKPSKCKILHFFVKLKKALKALN